MASWGNNFKKKIFSNPWGNNFKKNFFLFFDFSAPLKCHWPIQASSLKSHSRRILLDVIGKLQSVFECNI